MIAVLAAALIAAWLSASWMLSLTGGDERAKPAAPVAGQSSIQMQGSPIDMANELASMDRARQKQMEELLQ